jgi:small subunit ribosomal protein S1
MERSEGSEHASVEDPGWWTELDEGYWQALLTQGEIAPAGAPPADYREMFEALQAESGSGMSSRLSLPDRGNGRDSESTWQYAQDCLEQGVRFSLKVSGANRGGVLVEWKNLQGFVPASHLHDMPHDSDPRTRVAELARRIGDSLTVRLIEVDRRQNRLVFSERAAQSDFQSPASILDSLQPGDVCQGTVSNLTSFGAFVDLGGVEGLIHISEISWDRVRHPSDVVQPGEELDVHVLGVNPEEKRIALSLKRLRPNPWSQAESRYQVGQVVEGVVTNVVSFGAFVRVEEGLEGLVHVSELADGTFLHPRNVVREGDEVRARVLNVDANKHRMGLSMRQVHKTGPASSG